MFPDADAKALQNGNGNDSIIVDGSEPVLEGDPFSDTEITEEAGESGAW